MRRDMTRDAVTLGAALVVLPLLSAASCSSPLSPSSDAAAATITVTVTGVVPREVRIKAWNHVRFVNNDSVPHQIVSDPVTDHSQCPSINGVGYLPSGSSGETRTLISTIACGFHDHLNQHDDSFKGRIIVEE
jgi:plastocyanin